MKKICLCCNKEFETNRNAAKYCSQECYRYFKILNRITCYCEYCGKELHLNRKEFERSKRHFCDKVCSGKFHVRENNPSYNSELDEEDRRTKRRIFGYKNFRKEVLERDNYTCQITGETNCDLEVHHLNGFDNYKNERLDTSNAVTLSKAIHAVFHKIYGYGDNTKEQFEEFVNNYKNNNMPIPR